MSTTLPPTAPALDIDAVRGHFPALSRHDRGRPVVLLDGPAGTQVPTECIAAMADYLSTINANSHGEFANSRATDTLVGEAHAVAAEFLGASDPGEIAFGPNMTTLTFAASRAIGRTLSAGDEIVVTRLDHDANVAPWLALEEERGVVIRWVDVRPDDCTLDLESLRRALGPRTRLVAVGHASNAVGTVNPVRVIADLVHDVGALLWVDAVHSAPHVELDVAALGADFLVCSPYKFYGPHLGVLWGRGELLDTLRAYKVRPSPDHRAARFEAGTPPHENLAGLLGTFRYLEWLGTSQGGGAGEPGEPAGRQERLRAALRMIRAYERELTLHLLEGLQAVPGVHIRGIVDADRVDERAPTVAFTMAGHTPEQIARRLGDAAIATWHGDYYAYELIRALGLAGSGGMVRVGLVHYNSADEVDQLVTELTRIAAS